MLLLCSSKFSTDGGSRHRSSSMTLREVDLFVIELSECTGNPQSWYLKKMQIMSC